VKAATERPRSRFSGCTNSPCVGSLGALAAAPLGEAVTAALGWRAGVLALAALAFGLMPAAWFAARADRIALPRADALERAEVGAAAVIGAALHRAPFQVMTGAYFVCGMQLLFVAVHLPSYLAICGMDPMLSAQALGVIGIFNVFGSVFFGWAGGRWPKLVLLGGIYVTRSVVLAGYFVAPPTPESTLVFAALMGFLWLGVGPLVAGSVVEMFGLRWQAMVQGLAFMSHQVGSFRWRVRRRCAVRCARLLRLRLAVRGRARPGGRHGADRFRSHAPGSACASRRRGGRPAMTPTVCDLAHLPHVALAGWSSHDVATVNGNAVRFRVMEDKTAPWHIHDHSDELFYVLSGAVSFRPTGEVHVSARPAENVRRVRDNVTGADLYPDATVADGNCRCFGGDRINHHRAIPISAGPSFVFLALDHDTPFIAESALAGLPVNAATIFLVLSYAVLALRHGMAIATGPSVAVWLVLAFIVCQFEWTLAGGLVANAITFAICIPLLHWSASIGKRTFVSRRCSKLPDQGAAMRGSKRS
jgi:mannose-6-phosphate isomerase-like protein (cupin superfamily)